MPLANPGQTSWVSASPPDYGALRPAVSASLTSALGPPVSVAVDVATGGTLFHYAKGVVVSLGREHIGLAAAVTRESMLVASDSGVIVGDERHPWVGGTAELLYPEAPQGRMMVCALQGDAWISVRQLTSDTTVDAICIARASLTEGARTQQRIESGFACAAISQSGVIGIGLNQGRFLGLNAGSLHERFELRLADPVYLVSAMGDDWGLVSAEPTSDQSTPPVERRARVRGVPGFHIRGNWRSCVRSVDGGGGIRWELGLGFPVLQPPIDAGGGRSYLVGKGLAAIQDGRLLWQKPANMRLLATCYGNGSLALAAGHQVRIVDHAGALRQTLSIRDRSRIVTLPTVGPNGELYVGTTTGFYVAR